MKKDKIKKIVMEGYGKIAQERTSCCGAPPVELDRSDIEASVLAEANLGLGCGNPTGLASLKPGEVVLDLGCGAGFDCFLAAQRVGKEGKVIGVDMTPEMVERARENARRGGYQNVEFRLGEIEHLPLKDNEVDVVISNCVINLSPEKERVFREAFRVLKPGGRIVVSDIVTAVPLPDSVKRSKTAYIACVAGAATKEEYIGAIKKAGFEDVEIASEIIVAGCCPSSDPILQALSTDPTIPPYDLQKVSGNIRSITVSAIKPKR